MKAIDMYLRIALYDLSESFTITRAQKCTHGRLTNATSRGINCQAFQTIQIEYTQVSFRFQLDLRVKKRYHVATLRLLLVIIYFLPRFASSVYPFAIA